MALRLLKGKVVGFSGDKTVKVGVPVVVRHPIYRKVLKRTRSFLCHNELGNLSLGAPVEIAEGKRYSKLKSWRVVRILSV